MKYRVIKKFGLFYPEVRSLFWWSSTSEPATSYHSLEDAIKDIEDHKNIFTKRKTDVVWRSW